MTATLPTWRDWVFSAKAFTAAMLALFIAFSLDLPRPYWAVGTVYIVSQPFSGALRAKGLWRLCGTCIGAAVAVAAVPNLVDAPPLLALALALWLGLCLSGSLLDPTPRSYGFMLAGYTTAFIAFPAVNDPGTIFDTAIARTEEIGLGIICALVVQEVVFPRHGAPLLRQRLQAWMGDVAQFGAHSLSGRLDDAQFIAERRRIARDSTALAAFFAQARHEAAVGRGALLWLPQLRERTRLVPAMISAIADRAEALRGCDPVASEALSPLIAAVASWMLEGADPARWTASVAGAKPLLARLDEAKRPGAPRDWAGLMREGLLIRLRELVETWRDCLTLSTRSLAAKPARLPSRRDVSYTNGHTDPPLVGLSGASAGFAVLLCCLFWILTGWSEGGSAVMMAAVATCLFAHLDDPAPAMSSFIAGNALAVVLAGVYLFGVLPAIDGFPLLALVLSVIYLPAGAAMAVPALAPQATAILVVTPTIMGLEETYTADFAHYVNSGAATIFGLIFGLVATRLFRSVGVAWRLRRLVQADRLDLTRLAKGQPGVDLRRVLAEMLDRFEAMAARLGAGDARSLDVAELADLRTAINLVRLRDVAGSLPTPARTGVEEVLANIAAEARGQAARDAVLGSIDAALTAALCVAGPSARSAAQALSGIRRALFPEAGPPPMPEVPPERRKIAA